MHHTDAEWKSLLSPGQYRVLRNSGTELPLSSPLDHASHCSDCTVVCCAAEATAFAFLVTRYHLSALSYLYTTPVKGQFVPVLNTACTISLRGTHDLFLPAYTKSQNDELHIAVGEEEWHLQVRRLRSSSIRVHNQV